MLEPDVLYSSIIKLFNSCFLGWDDVILKMYTNNIYGIAASRLLIKFDMDAFHVHVGGRDFDTIITLGRAYDGTVKDMVDLMVGESVIRPELEASRIYLLENMKLMADLAVDAMEDKTLLGTYDFKEKYVKTGSKLNKMGVSLIEWDGNMRKRPVIELGGFKVPFLPKLLYLTEQLMKAHKKKEMVFMVGIYEANDITYNIHIAFNGHEVITTASADMPVLMGSKSMERTKLSTTPHNKKTLDIAHYLIKQFSKDFSNKHN
jgi:hypothetical protein